MTSKVILSVEGLTDNNSARRVEVLLLQQPGVILAIANSTVSRVLIEYEVGVSSLVYLQDLLMTAGYQPILN